MNFNNSLCNIDIKCSIKHELSPSRTCDGELPDCGDIAFAGPVDPLKLENVKFIKTEIEDESLLPEYGTNFAGTTECGVLEELVKKEKNETPAQELQMKCHNNDDESAQLEIKDESIEIGPEVIMEYSNADVILKEIINESEASKDSSNEAVVSKDQHFDALFVKNKLEPSKDLKSKTSTIPSDEPSAESCNDDSIDHRSLKCKFCDKVLKFESELIRHSRSHTGERPFPCDKCQKRFPAKSQLNAHRLQTHTGVRPHTCNDCGETFPRKFSLMRHRRIHTGERPFHCDQCGLSFTQKNILKCHKQKHNGDRPFKCEQCEKAFSRRIYLETHAKTTHNTSSEESLKCDLRKKINISLEKTNAVRVASDNDLHKCDECGQEFCRRSQLVVHLRSHTGERPFKCEDCDQCFSQQIVLVRHKRTHTGERPFQCDECGQMFNQKVVLIRHKRRHLKKKA